MNILVRSAKQASISLTLGGSDHWEALWTDRAREEKHQLERSFNNLTLQKDMYLRESQKASIYLKEVRRSGYASGEDDG